MTDEYGGVGQQPANQDDLIEIDLNFESMRRFQAEFSPNLSKEGIFIDTGEPLDPGSVVRFRVILPEDFIFLEGTAIVEWSRGAEGMAEGAPGMALRFATLSPQNQELVEQLVQDHINAGGTPFNLDVRPTLGDFPTDALEGASSKDDVEHADGYRLTIRNTGLTVEEETIGGPDVEVPEDDGPAEDVQEAPSPASTPSGEQPSFGFENVPGESVAIEEDKAEEATPEPEPESVLAVGDPPDLDWTEEEEVPPVEPTPIEEPVESEPDPVILGVPKDFDEGPEVIDTPVDNDLGSPAFDVSLPEDLDEEPDSTPVLPDEGENDVALGDHYDDEPPERRRRLWPYVLGVIFLFAVAGGFLRPHVAGWLESRGAEEPASAVEVADAAPVVEAEPIAEDPANGATTATEEPDTEGGEVLSSEPAATEPEEGDETVEAAITEPETAAPEDPPAAPVEEPVVEVQETRADLPTAAAVETIAVVPGPNGSVVRIRGDGPFADGAVTVEALSSPARALIRLRGIDSAFRPYTVEGGTLEVSQLRMGHHAERRPPELWIVVDLTGPSVTVGDLLIRGDSVELILAGR